VIDLGNGTGTMCRQLAGLVAPSISTDGPTGWVTGVEPNARLRTLAASRAQDNGVPNISSSMVSPARCRSRTRASISSGASAYYNTSAIRMRPSMTSPGCCDRAAAWSSWTPTRGRELSPISIPTSPPRLSAHHWRRSPTRMQLDSFPRRSAELDSHWTRTWARAAFIFSSEMLLRSQVLQRAADDAVESGGLARDVAEAAVRAVQAAAERGEAFAAITVFGFIARKLDAAA
jgi:hypothetical protein